MPFRHLYRRNDLSHDYDDNRADFHSHSVPLSNPNTYQWHEIDYTTVPMASDLDSKYSVSMDTDQDMSYLQDGSLDQSISPSNAGSSTSLFSTGPYSYSHLLNVDNSPLQQQSSSLTPTDSDQMLDDDIPTSPELLPIIASSSTGEKICPLIAGQVDSCQPSRCGPDAPCMNFTNLPPIEECTSVPCISQASPLTTTITTKPSPPASRTSLPRNSTRRTSSSTQQEYSPQSQPSTRRTNQSITTTMSNTTRRRTRETSPITSKPTDSKQRAKQAHSLVERKYRENLNAKIAQLHTTLRATHYGPKFSPEDSDSDSDSPNHNNIPNLKIQSNAAASGAKFRKSDVLTDAMAYVNQTEVEMRHMENEITRLSERVKALEKMNRMEEGGGGSGGGALRGYNGTRLGVQAATAAM